MKEYPVWNVITHQTGIKNMSELNNNKRGFKCILNIEIE